MPTSVTIRDVPNRVRDELASRAAASGRSLQEYLRAKLVELASRPDPEAVLARIRERKERTGARLPAAAILRHRDARRFDPDEAAERIRALRRRFRGAPLTDEDLALGKAERRTKRATSKPARRPLQVSAAEIIRERRGE